MDRSKFVVEDAYGVDPLADDLVEKLLEITTYIEHTVALHEESNPQLIAYRYYNSVELYFVILYYNGIGNSFALERGTLLRIPRLTEIQRILSDKKYTNKLNVNTTMEI